MLEKRYSPKFFSNIRENSAKSADVIVPMILDLLKPTSVIDIGCGDGTWLKRFMQYGIQDLLGLDGGDLDEITLRVPSDIILKQDLTQMMDLHRTFDLALSLEVAEHLPPEFARQFVHQLTKLAPMVVFSAAIPMQPGDFHINAQFQKYWMALFDDLGYQVFDVLRPNIWDHKEVSWWYAQDTLIYISRDYLSDKPDLQRELNKLQTPIISIVHPECYLYQWNLKKYLTKAPQIFYRSIKRILHKQSNKGG